jgi:hypothetical protein
VGAFGGWVVGLSLLTLGLNGTYHIHHTK